MSLSAKSKSSSRYTRSAISRTSSSHSTSASIDRSRLSGQLAVHHVSTQKTFENLIVLWYGYLKKFNLITLSFCSYFNALRDNPKLIRPSYPENELLSFYEMESLINLGNSIADQLAFNKYRQNQDSLNEMSKLNSNTNQIPLFFYLRDIFEEIRCQIDNLFTKCSKFVDEEFQEKILSYEGFLSFADNAGYQLELIKHYHRQSVVENFRNVSTPIPPILKEMVNTTIFSPIQTSVTNSEFDPEFFLEMSDLLIIPEYEHKTTSSVGSIVKTRRNEKESTDNRNTFLNTVRKKLDNVTYRDMILFAKDAKDAREMEAIADIMEDDSNDQIYSKLSREEEKNIAKLMNTSINDFDVNFRTPF
eukprot:TRINITY_DN1018_c0_g1_i1.p1 TRINITY_DN1018_c0_g1~~TRINITY_DN1018_c0_g1_i1.p1  ORF type:complete len:361 (+),score=77.09 TRINITY_DN1018_c0_g1_i1:66-1148(+)